MKEVLKKAAITTTTITSGGLLNRQQFNAFVNLVQDYSRFLKLIRTIPINHPSGQIDKIDHTLPVTKKTSGEATTESTTIQPTFSKVNYDTVKLVSAYDVSTETEEDNIEGKKISTTIMNSFTNQIATDMSDLAINGDTSLGGTDRTSLLRKANQGLHVLTVTCPNILDANGLGVSLKLFKDALNKMPVRYKGRLRKSLKWFIASNPYEDLVYEYGNRATAGGDSIYTGTVNLKPFGIPLEECPLFPVDLTIGTAQTDGSFIILTDPRNLIWFLQRKLAIHFDFQARKDLTEVTMYTRTDFNIENINALVKVRSISADATAYA